jgi:hypothetical protein
VITSRYPSFDATNCSSASDGESARIGAMISGGVAAGSKFSSTRVGAPDRPATVDICQKPLTVIMCATTSWTVQPSQRVGAFQSAAASSASSLGQALPLAHDRNQLIVGGAVDRDDRRLLVSR